MLSLSAIFGAISAALALGGGSAPREGALRDAEGVVAVVQHHDHKHAGSSGHLPPAATNVERVSTLPLSSGPRKRIADVAVWNGHAYLGSWAGTCENNGVHVVDIRNPSRPKKLGFIPAPRASYPGEGVQALHVTTASFRGDLLVTNNETCDRANRLGGMNLYDVSRPSRPRTLVEGFGDKTEYGEPRSNAAEIHSVFVWDAGRKAYAVLVDNLEEADVDIVDISNPRQPVLIAEYDLRRSFPQITQSRPTGLDDVFHHDVVVKKVGARQVMLVSYWDGGYVKLDVTNPRRARYIADSDFAVVDGELLAQAALRERPEGNAHQSELTRDNAFLIGADEDFGPTGLDAAADDDGGFLATPASGARALEIGSTLSGRARYVGRACDEDPAVPAPAGATFAVVSRGLCPFTGKVARVEAAGYAAAIVVNSEGRENCGRFRITADAGIPAFSVARPVGFNLFDQRGYDDGACRSGSQELLSGVALGQEGDVVTVRSFFDGWGYVHLYRNTGGKLDQLDAFAIPEAMDPKYAKGYGDLSVHEVAASHVRDDLAYLSYYAGGLRVIRVERGKIVEAGRFIDRDGNNLWGVQVFRHRGREYVAASDIDFGLYIFRYTGRD